MTLTETGEVLLSIRLAGSLVRSKISEAVREELSGRALLREVAGVPGGESQLCLTEQGRLVGEELLADELESLKGRAVAEASYLEFLPVNATFLGLCRDWQLRPAEDGDDRAQVLNDHTDKAWDEGVLDRLSASHRAVTEIVAQLAGALPRFAAYRGRFEKALARVHAGEPQWFTRPMIDSYHTVWFELHENLLATLGLDRHRESRNV